MHDNMLKPWDVHPVTISNHVSTEQSSVSVRIQKTLLGNSWRN